MVRSVQMTSNSQATLASRQPGQVRIWMKWRRSVLQPVELTAYTARQIRALGSDKLTTRLTSSWGELHETPADAAKKDRGDQKMAYR